MENESRSESPIKVVVPIIIEIGIIFILTTIVFFVLNYLKLINVGLLFKSPPITTVKSKSVPEITKQIVPTGEPSHQKPFNPALPNMAVISKNKALHNEFQAFEFEGKVGAVIDVPGVDPVFKVPFAVRLEVNVGTESAQVVLLYPLKSLDKIQILDSQKRKINFKDLEKGDAIVIKTTLSTFIPYPDNYYTVFITKL